MHKEATINARIEPKLKADAEHILHAVGLSSAEAVRLFTNKFVYTKAYLLMFLFQMKQHNKQWKMRAQEKYTGPKV